MMVQGFDAADPARVSAREIVEEWGSGALGASQMRPQGGYGALLETFFSPAKFQIALARPVRDVRWQGGASKSTASRPGTRSSRCRLACCSRARLRFSRKSRRARHSIASPPAR
jgi:hypothetical protein